MIRLLLCLAALDGGILAAALRRRDGIPAAGPSRAGRDDEIPGGWDLCARPTWRNGFSIPKIVHHTYKNSTLPWRLHAFQQTWPFVLKKNWNQTGGWSEMFWGDLENRNLIKDHYPWFLETYDNYEEVINRVDAARIFFLHRYGGVYADLDIEVMKNPGPLFSGDNELVFFYQKSPYFRNKHTVDPVEEFELGSITNALMASVPGHPFWLFLAEKMMYAAKHRIVLPEEAKNWTILAGKDTRIFWTTGPSILQNALAEYQLKEPTSKVLIYSERYWAPFRYDGPWEERCEFLFTCVYKYPQAYMVSHWTGTWNHCEEGSCDKNDPRPVLIGAPSNEANKTSLLGVSTRVRQARRRDALELACV